jgi:hypothetical protein
MIREPIPLTITQRTALIKSLQQLVKRGLETDCEALADYVDQVAQGLEGSQGAAQQLKASLVQLTPNQFPVYLIPGLGGNSAYTALNANQSPSGFQTQFQDQIPNADQAHHFAAFFQLGFVYGAGTGALAATWWERLEGTAGNVGDINLGTVAARMGAYLASGVLPVNQVADTIRENLCK